MFFLRIVHVLCAGQRGNVKDTERVQQPVPNRVCLNRVCHDAKKQHRDWHREQDKGKVGEHKDEPEQECGPADGTPGLQFVLKHTYLPQS